MGSSFGVSVSFGEAKVYDEDNIFFLCFAHHKIISLDVSVNEALAMNCFQPVDNLNSDLKNCTDGKFALISLK